MQDEEIVRRIGDLTAEEHRLEGAGLDRSETDDERLHSVEVALDQCWDLLRQRRARRASGRDPDEAQVRPEAVVESYEQ